MAEIHWKREFEQLGSNGVRAALISAKWPNDKRAAAREWLERTDASAWQSTRHGEGAPATAMEVFRRYRWVYYIAGGGFGVVALLQVVGKLF